MFVDWGADGIYSVGMISFFVLSLATEISDSKGCGCVELCDLRDDHCFESGTRPLYGGCFFSDDEGRPSMLIYRLPPLSPTSKSQL